MDNEKSYPGYYAIITADVRYSKKLEPNAKLLYGEITALANMNGYAWASNKYFQDLYDVDERTIRRWLESLKKEGFIYVDIEKHGMSTSRKIWIKQKITTGQKCPGREDKNVPLEGAKMSPIILHGSSITEEQQQAAPAAAAVPSKKEKKKAVLYGCLESIDIPEKEKVWITQRYDEQTVQDAIAYATSPQTKITTTLVQTIKWACSEKPKMPKSKEEQIQDNKYYAEYYRFRENHLVRIDVLSKTIEVIYKGVQKEPFVLSYEENDFENKLNAVLEKNYIAITDEETKKAFEAFKY